MLNITENVSLKPFNTFGIDVKARWFVTIEDESQLVDLYADRRWINVPQLILGGGSNMLFTKDFDGIIVKMGIGGLCHDFVDDRIRVKAGAGIVWNQFVMYCVERGFAGAENLSLIPGTVGAAPVQNIGAYGVELKDIFHSCTVFFKESLQSHTFFKDDCGFAYRESVFKSKLKENAIITEVTFDLSKHAITNTSYGAINEELIRRGITQPDVRDVAKVVSEIRVSKLPDPSTVGNAGSFFKNPLISAAELKNLQSTFPDIVHYCMPNSTIKVAAGWLIEQCGWKGKIFGNTGTWKNQALVLINSGSASGLEVYNFSQVIIDDVKSKFGIQLEREVNVF